MVQHISLTHSNLFGYCTAAFPGAIFGAVPYNTKILNKLDKISDTANEIFAGQFHFQLPLSSPLTSGLCPLAAPSDFCQDA